MQNPDICRRLIEKLLHIKVKQINYPEAEKTLTASPVKKSVRLDLYVETETGTMIDIEMQTVEKSAGWLQAHPLLSGHD